MMSSILNRPHSGALSGSGFRSGFRVSCFGREGLGVWPSLDASSLRSDVITSTKIISLVEVGDLPNDVLDIREAVLLCSSNKSVIQFQMISMLFTSVSGFRSGFCVSRFVFRT